MNLSIRNRRFWALAALVAIVAIGVGAYALTSRDDTNELGRSASRSGSDLTDAEADQRAGDSRSTPDGPTSEDDQALRPGEVGPDVQVVGGGQEGSGAPPRVVTSVDLEPFLLRGSDLPPGWVTIDPESSGDLGGSCLGGFAPTTPRAEGRVVFRRGQTGPVMSNRVADHLDEAAASDELALLRGAVAACVDAGPGPGEPTIVAIEIESEADATLAVGLRYEEGNQAVGGELLFARVGQRIATVLTLSVESTDLSTGRAALATVVERLRDA